MYDADPDIADIFEPGKFLYNYIYEYIHNSSCVIS